MVFQYYPDTDMLYITLVDTTSVDSEEAAPGIVLDFDEKKRVIGRSKMRAHLLICRVWRSWLYPWSI